MIKRLLLLIGLTWCLPEQAAAQSAAVGEKKNKNSGWFNVTQLGYSRGFGTARFRDDVVVRNGGYVGRLRTTFGYFVTPHTSVGLGFGLDGYHNPGYNTAPLVADARYYWNPTGNSPFVAANAGYSLGLARAFQRGAVGSANAGYRFIWGRRTHLLVSAGVDVHQIKEARILVFTPSAFERVQNNIWLQSLALNAGFLF